MNPLFQSIQIRKPGKNRFDLSHEKKLSCNMGELVPVLLQEIVPGDKFRVNTELLVRFAPMKAPMMHRVNVFTHFFFVPTRLLYADWEKFITGGVTGTESPAFPLMEISEASKALFAQGTLADYLGIPSPPAAVVTNPLYVSALPFRGYQLIYNEYYRDQTLHTPVALTKDGVVAGAERDAITTLRKRCVTKDYFSSALPWAQRGGEVMLPTESVITYKDPAVVKFQGLPASGALSGGADGHLDVAGLGDGTIDNIDSIDEQITVNELRRAIKLQEWLEKNARAGSRYIEQIFAHFGVKSSDARLQRPEYLGGGKSPVVISEVLQTSKTDVSPQGHMAGHGISVGNTHQFKRFFEEHGYVIGIMSVLPAQSYQQGLPKMFSRTDKFDYYWPEFAKLGEQEVKKKEIYAAYTGANTNEDLFGYQSRYSEYKYNPSTVHGDFKDTLSYWHMGNIYNSCPALNAAFVEANPTHRIFAVEDPSYDKLYVQLYNNVKAIRPMPIFGEPSLI